MTVGSSGVRARACLEVGQRVGRFPTVEAQHAAVVERVDVGGGQLDGGVVVGEGFVEGAEAGVGGGAVVEGRGEGGGLRKGASVALDGEGVLADV